MSETPPITPDVALADTTTTSVQSAEFELNWEVAQESAALLAEERWIRAGGLRQHFIHKGWWSGVLLGTIVFMVLFESLMIGLVGCGVWNFEKYAWLLPTLMIQFLAQIVGLGLLVVRSLFKQIS
jgi:hypothetical protein